LGYAGPASLAGQATWPAPACPRAIATSGRTKHDELLERAKLRATQSVAAATLKAEQPLITRFLAHCQSTGFPDPVTAPSTVGATFLEEILAEALAKGHGRGVLDLACAAVGFWAQTNNRSPPMGEPLAARVLTAGRRVLCSTRPLDRQPILQPDLLKLANHVIHDPLLRATQRAAGGNHALAQVTSPLTESIPP
jgi:hypothetical protein